MTLTILHVEKAALDNIVAREINIIIKKTYNLSFRWHISYHLSMHLPSPRPPPPPHTQYHVARHMVHTCIYINLYLSKVRVTSSMICTRSAARSFYDIRILQHKTTILRHEQPCTHLYPHCSVAVLRYGSQTRTNNYVTQSSK